MDSKQDDNSHTNTNGIDTDKNEILVSRAQSILRQATLLRDGSKPTSATQGPIEATVKALHKEKTRLKSSRRNSVYVKSTVSPPSDEDDEMSKYLQEMKLKKAKELTDSDFDTDLEEEEEGYDIADRSKKKLPKSELYEKTCKRLGVPCLPSVRETLSNGSDIIASNKLMNALDLLCLTNALINNTVITRLILDGNHVGDAGALCLAYTLQDHGCHLQSVSLADNSISDEGFQALGEILEDNKTLTFLNLSGNAAQDDNVTALAESLKENRSLQYLNLSHNNIGDEGATLLAAAIAVNEGLQTLNLSWNKIRAAGSVAICSALKENIMLKSLHLEMNGLGMPGAMFIGNTLTENSTLTYLNVTFNRINDEGATLIAKGLQKNEGLHHLIIHNNPITAKSAMTLLRAIEMNSNTAMWKLDMSSVPVVKESVELADTINFRLGEFEFRYSGVVNCEASMTGVDGNKLNAKNPLALVKEYIENEGLRMLDFFKQMDKDQSGTISRDEFVVGLRNANVLLSQAQMDRLMEMLDKDGDGEIDYGELIEGNRELRKKARLRRKTEMDLIATLTSASKDYFGYQSQY